MKNKEQYDVIIIGGGAAGLTAAIYLGRAKLNTLLIEKTLVGGLATYTNEIENYPGFPDGATGSDLMNLFYKQAKKFGVKFKFTDVKSAKLEGKIKTVETFRCQYQAKSIVIASGGKPKLTKAKNEEFYLYDKGISFCATCDAAANTGNTVMVVGSGDAAIEEGIFLSKFANKVIVSVIHEENKMDCNEIAKIQALNNPKMEFIWNTVVERFEGKEFLEQVILKNVKTESEIPIKVDSCFLFIGYQPNTEVFSEQIKLDKRGYILVNDKMETNLPGVFAAGDVCDKFLKQVATAVGDGAIAGYSAEKYIAESEIYEEQILNYGNPSLVFFFNSVDFDCQKLFLLIERVKQQYKKQIKVVLIDVYKSDGLARRMGVSCYPSAIYFNKNIQQGCLEKNFSLEDIEIIVNCKPLKTS